MKWYFACNDKSPDYEYMIKAAVTSALENTSLTPVFVYDGQPGALTEWMDQKGVRVIFHHLSFYSSLECFYPEAQLNVASGTFLRCDIPILEDTDEVVLYTDCDVMFTGEVSFEENPVCFSCAPESHKTDWSVLNTGVMLMNIPALRETHAEFVEFIKHQLPELNTYDQSAYNRFYSSRASRLPLEYNWKTYWGQTPDAKIIHFHGPKPHDLLRILNGEPTLDIYQLLFRMDRFSSIYYLGEFCRCTDRPEFETEAVLQKSAAFLADTLQATELELKAALRKQLGRRLKKNMGRMINQLNPFERNS